MLVLGIESSCDETGCRAFTTTARGLLAHYPAFPGRSCTPSTAVWCRNSASRDHTGCVLPLARASARR